MSSFPAELEIPLGKRSLKYRLFEILPGLLTWTVLSLPIVLSILDPTSRLAAAFILFFMISWFYRAVGMAFRTLQGYNHLKTSAQVNWKQWLSDIDSPKLAIERLSSQFAQLNRSEKAHLANLQEYLGDPALSDLAPRDLLQLVIVPMWKESYEVVEPTLEAIKNSDYNNEQVIVVIAYEKRGGEVPEQTAKKLVAKYGREFKYATAIQHQDNPATEVIGKGGNVTWAARHMLPYFKEQAIDPSRVVVTTLDADNRLHQHYLAHVAYSYILTHDRKHHSYQPLAIYTNNIWDAPAPMRVLAVGNSFFTITQSVRPHLLRNFSSHAQSLDALIETDFWSTRTVVEDGHQFWRSYFRFGGNHNVVPIYAPTYQDAVLSESYPATLKAQFVQVRRWAYGASDIAYIANLGFRRKKNRIVPFRDFFFKFCRLVDTHVSWGTVALLLLLAPRVPLLLGPHADRSIVAHQLPLIASYAQTVALIGLSISIFLSMKLLPPRPARYRRHRTVLMVMQWVLLPITSIIYGSGAALNSQTRLILGKYLDKFDLTHKGIKAAAKSKTD